MKKEINKTFLEYITKAFECKDEYGECTVNLTRSTIKHIVKLVKETIECPVETSPLKKDNKEFILFGCKVKINNKLPKNEIHFKPSGKILILK